MISRVSFIVILVLSTAHPAARASDDATHDPAAAAAVRTTTAEDGTKIAYEIVGEGEPALVFVHCWACNRTFWKEQREAFAADHTVVLLDLPGHGASGRDREEWTLGAYAEDVVSVVDAAGLDRVVLIGHSMGGPVTLLAAPKLGKRLTGVLCVDTLHDAEFEWPEETIDQWIGGFEEDYEGAMEEAIAGMTPGSEELRGWIVEQGMSADRSAMVELLHQFQDFDPAAALSSVEAPVRCVNAAPYGENGRPTATQINRRYADFDAVLIDGVGHYLQLERPEEFNRKMRAMLEEIEAARSDSDTVFEPTE